MTTIYQVFQQAYSKFTIGIGLYVLGLLYGCQGTHQMGMDPGENTEADLAVEVAAITSCLPRVIQNPHNEEHVYVEVPNVPGSNISEGNIARAINMAQIVQQARGIQFVLITNYTHLWENRDNEVRYLETQCSNLFGNVENLRNYQNHVLVGINQVPPQIRLNDMRTFFRQMGSPTMQILANRIYLYDPHNQVNDNPDVWSIERFNEEIARMPHVPDTIAANLYRTMLKDDDKALLQRCLDHQVTKISNAINRNDYDTVNQCWPLIKMGRTIYPHAVVALRGQELLSMRLNMRNIALDTVDSAAIVHYCAALRDRNIAAYNDKNAIAILGETGSGKSTATNYWMGLNMVQRTPEEMEALGIQRILEDVIMVDPASAQPEVTPIGHGRVSHTFSPQITQDTNNDTHVYVDCPGFSDNRGAEINIANAINIRRILQQTRGVKAIFIAKYQDLISRGTAVERIAEVCEQMFGNIGNFERHKDSVLLGINRAPAQANIQRIHRSLSDVNFPPILRVLGQRAFLYDPLEQGGADCWSRDRLLNEIEQMPAIPQQVAQNMFQTALTNSDRIMLQQIVSHQVGVMSNALTQEDYPAADRCWSLLNKLRIIEHSEIEELMKEQVRPHMRAYAEARTAAFSRHAANHQFTEAEQILAALQALNEHFSNEQLVDLGRLESILHTARTQYKTQQEAEERVRREQAARDIARREREEMEARVRRREAELAEAKKQEKIKRIMAATVAAAGVVAVATGGTVAVGVVGDGFGTTATCPIM
ncbi:MAG: hypothetical protein ACX93T_03105 [Bacteroidota bacterium]